MRSALGTWIAALVVGISLASTGSARAGLINGGFNDAIVAARSWTAGVDRTETWYGYRFDASAGFASFAPTSIRDRTATLLQAIDLDAVGEYTVSFDMFVDRASTRLNTWQVYAVEDGALIDLGAGTRSTRGDASAVSLLLRERALPSRSDAGWTGFLGAFTVTADDATNYDYLVLQLTVTGLPGQQARIDNVSMIAPRTIPTPGSLALLGLGAFAAGRSRRRRAGDVRAAR